MTTLLVRVGEGRRCNKRARGLGNMEAVKRLSQLLVNCMDIMCGLFPVLLGGRHHLLCPLSLPPWGNSDVWFSASTFEPTKLTSSCYSNIRHYFCGKYGMWRLPRISLPIPFYIFGRQNLLEADSCIQSRQCCLWKRVFKCLPHQFFVCSLTSFLSFYVHFKAISEP